jgi:hypothetical protein
MSNTLTFQDYIKNELEEQDIKNKEYEYDDYSITTDIDYTTQE